MTRKDLIYLAAILGILTVSFYIGSRQGKENEQLRNANEFLQSQVNDLTAARDSALSQAAQESSKRQVIVLAAGKEQAALRGSVASWKARVRILDKSGKMPPTPVSVSDTAKIPSPCEAQDSVIANLDQLVVSLDQEKIAITNSFEKELTFTKAALESEKAISEVWRAGNESSQTKLRRAERRKKLWRGIATVATVGLLGVFIGSQ